MCFVDTVDWLKLGVQEIHFANINNGTCDSCPRNCPDKCWNSKLCQLESTEMCHHECLGCHQNGSAEHCYVCRNYENNGVCVENCPKNKFIHVVTNKCVTESECKTWNGTTGTWFTFGDSCMEECPPFYEQYNQTKGRKNCRPCGADCERVCKGGPIENEIRLQELRGCTHIRGSLIIRMEDRDVEKLERDLIENLGMIRYIRDSLVIRRTNAIRSLNFLRSLNQIRGKYLENSKYAVFIVQNSNLRTLLNYSKPNFNLTITNGGIAFHDNPLLCPSEIEKFAKVLNVEYNEVDVSPYSNGEKAACVILNMSITVVEGSHNASLTWISKDDVTALGYIVYYKPWFYHSNSIRDSMEVCVINMWQSVFTWNNSVVLMNLKPFTVYYYLIKMYDRKTNGAQSQLLQFRTLSDDPDPPRKLTAQSYEYFSITLHWSYLGESNGILSHYKTDYNEIPDGPITRNYCENPITPDGYHVDKLFEEKDLLYEYDTGPENRKFPTTKPKTNKNVINNNNCTCPANTSKPSEKEDEDDDLDEWSLHNLDARLEICDTNVLSKFQRKKCGKFEYGLDQYEGGYKISKRRSEEPKPNEIFKYYGLNYYNYSNTVYISAELPYYNITGLKHFTMYAIYFSSCNAPLEEKKCSSVAFIFQRTQKKPGADDIQTVDYTVNEQDATITWKEPTEPNGAIVAYRVTYEYLNAENVIMNSSYCIPRNIGFNGSKLELKSLQPGKYTLKVQAESLAGLGNFSVPIVFKILKPQGPTNDIIVIIIPIVVIIVVCLGAILTYRWYSKKKRARFEEIQLITTVNPDYDGEIYVADEWEIDRNDVEIEENLGHGTFGVVHYGQIKSKKMPCAIKSLNENATIGEQMEFLNEAHVMKSFSNCHHVVRLLGVVSKGQPPLVIMELMDRGDLKKYLRQMRDSSQTLGMNEIYRMSAEIADGMTYLQTKKFIHRDLAARNCMVAADRTVKIGDFGMARDVYETDYYKKETKGLLPVRWMAPESLADGVFTTDSDVWSYGIVLWEIATLAEQPYQGMSNEQVLQFVVSKGRLTRPPECSDLLYQIMKQCWSWRPVDRPTFWSIVTRLVDENRIGMTFKPVSFIYSREGEQYSMKHGRQRTVNQPAMAVEASSDMFCQYRASEEDVVLTVGSIPKRSMLDDVAYPGGSDEEREGFLAEHRF